MFDAPTLLGRCKQPSRAPASARRSSLESLSPQLSNALMQAINGAPQHHALHSNVKLCRFFFVKACSPRQDVIAATDDDERECVEKLTTATSIAPQWTRFGVREVKGGSKEVGSVNGFEASIGIDF